MIDLVILVFMENLNRKCERNIEISWKLVVF